MVDVAAKMSLKNSITLSQIKLNTKLNHLALVTQSRLSVMPIDLKSWKIINKLSLKKSE